MQMEMGLVQTLLSHLLQLDIVLRRPTSTAEATSVTAGISFHFLQDLFESRETGSRNSHRQTIPTLYEARHLPR